MKSMREQSVQSLSRMLVEKAGLRLQTASLEGALERAVRRAGAESLDRYAADVAVGRASIEPLVEETRVAETYFFREPHQLEFLARHLFDDRPAGGPPLRLWSAGCASGEEAYTLAMMAVEAGIGTEILGTDISPAAVLAARRATFGEWSLRGPSKERARRYLEAHENGLAVTSSVRARVSFAVHNLVSDVHATPRAGGGWDAILCRNVLIYFDQPTQKRVIATLANALVEGGWLFLGSCDPPAGPACPMLAVVVADEGIFYRKVSSPQVSSEIFRSKTPSPPVAPRPRPSIDVSRSKIPIPADPEVSSRAPEDARAACLRGLGAIEMGARDVALDLLRRALFLEPELVVAQLATAAVFERDGELRPARLGYRRALRLAERHAADAEVPLAAGATYGDIVAHCRRTIASLGEEDGDS